MDSYSEEKTCIDDESRNLQSLQEPSSRSEDSGDEEQVDPEDGTWQTGSNRNVGAALPFTDPTPGLAVSNITFSSTHLEFLTFFFFFYKISDVDTC
jgi:hypothetical protein